MTEQAQKGAAGVIRFAALVFCGLAALLMVASFLGVLHPVGDSLAVFRYQIMLILLLSGLAVVRRFRLLLGGLLVLALVLGPLVRALTPAPVIAEQRYALYQKNILFSNPTLEALEDEIISADADFVTLQEVWRLTMPLWDGLRAHYPGQLLCRGHARAAAVLSKYPSIPGQQICAPAAGLAAIKVMTPDGPLWVAALHLNWPYPKSQMAQVARLEPILKGLDAPVVIGGDFNSVPWSHAVRRLERASGSARAGPITRSFVGFAGLLRLPIDHVLTPGGQGVMERRPLVGSDHFGLLVGFSL